jgi:hypothetical protein
MLYKTVLHSQLRGVATEALLQELAHSSLALGFDRTCVTALVEHIGVGIRSMRVGRLIRYQPDYTCGQQPSMNTDGMYDATGSFLPSNAVHCDSTSTLLERRAIEDDLVA